MNVNLTGVVKQRPSYDPLGRPTLVPAIKALRSVTGMSLRGTKEVVYALNDRSLASYPLQQLSPEAVGELYRGGFIYGAVESNVSVTVNDIPPNALHGLTALVEAWGGSVTVNR